MNTKINYTAKLIHQVLPSSLDREDAARQMGEHSRRIIKTFPNHFKTVSESAPIKIPQKPPAC